MRADRQWAAVSIRRSLGAHCTVSLERKGLKNEGAQAVDLFNVSQQIYV